MALKIGINKKGQTYVRYRKRNHIIPKNLKNASSDVLMAWLIKKLANTKIKRKSNAKTRRNVKKNLRGKLHNPAVQSKLEQTTASNKVVAEDLTGNMSYANALRKQNGLQPFALPQGAAPKPPSPRAAAPAPQLALPWNPPPAAGPVITPAKQSASVLLSPKQPAVSLSSVPASSSSPGLKINVSPAHQTTAPAGTTPMIKATIHHPPPDYNTVRDEVIKEWYDNKKYSQNELYDELLRAGIGEHKLKQKKKGGINATEKKNRLVLWNMAVKDGDAPDIVKAIDAEVERRIKASYVVTGSGEDVQPLSNLQIDKFMAKYKEYLGCVPYDKIGSDIVPKIKEDSKGGFVFNLDHSSGPGTHWVSVYFTPQTIEYYNSFGEEPGPYFKDIAKQITNKVNPGGFLKLKINHIQRQANDTQTCGYHAMKFIIDRIKGKSFSEATGYNDHIKDDHIRGEKAVDKFIDHIQYGNGFQFIHGEGIIDKAKAVVKKVKDVLSGTRQRASPSIRKFMAENGEAKIKKIVIGRQPITSMVEKVASWLSLGKWDANKKKLGYDKMMHLFMIITLDNGKTFKLEKNHLPEIINSTSAGNDTMNVATPNTTFNDFIANGEKKAGGNKFWVYDAVTQNCQYFVKWCLQGSGVWNEDLNKFVMQDAAKVIEGLPFFDKIARAATDAANVADVAINGEGKKKSKRNI